MKKLFKLLTRYFNFNLDTFFVCKDIKPSLHISELDDKYSFSCIAEYDQRLLTFYTHIYGSSQSSSWEKKIKKRYSEGSQCFVLWHIDSIVAVTWQAPVTIKVAEFVNYIEVDTTIGESYWYYFDAIVAPEHRGKRLQVVLQSLIYESISSNKALGFIGVKNIASLINCRKIFKRFKLIHVLTVDVLGIKRTYFPMHKSENWRDL